MQVDNYSLDGQRDANGSLIQARGWNYIGSYRDEGISAKTTERPDFQRMLSDAYAGKFDVIVVWKLNRFSRSISDTLITLRELDKLGIALVSVTEPFDFTTAIGKALLVILVLFAEIFLDNLSEDTARGKKDRAEAGHWNSQVPFGYHVHYKKDGGDGLPRPDSHEQAGYLLACEAYATGDYSDAGVARVLNEAGYRPKGRGKRALKLWTKDTVSDMLKNRFYLGEVQYKGEWFPGQHDPLVSRELWEQVQRTRRERYKGRPHLSATRKSRVYVLSGVARCARCQQPLRGSAGPSGRYYRDPATDRNTGCDLGTIRAEEAEQAVGELLRQVSLPDDWKEQILAAAQEPTNAKNIKQERSRLNRQLDALKLQHRLGDIPDAEYLSERERIQAELGKLQPPRLTPVVEDAAALLQNFGTIWDVATDKERKQVVRSLLQAVHLDKADGGVIVSQITPKPAFEPLFQLAK